MLPAFTITRLIDVRLRNNNDNVLVHSRSRYDTDFEVGGLRGPREGTVSTSLDSVISGCIDINISDPVLVRFGNCRLLSRSMELACL